MKDQEITNIKLKAIERHRQQLESELPVVVIDETSTTSRPRRSIAKMIIVNIIGLITIIAEFIYALEMIAPFIRGVIEYLRQAPITDEAHGVIFLVVFLAMAIPTLILTAKAST